MTFLNFALQSVIVKSAEKNVARMYLARQDILGLDGNENLAVSSTFSTPSLVNHRIPSPDNLTRNYFSMLNLSSSPPGYVHGHMNGHSSPILSPVDPVSNNPHPWFTSTMSPTSPTISNMIGGLVTSPIHPLMNCSTTYPNNPPPPPGLGPPVTVASIHNSVPGGYVINYSGSMPSSDGYGGSMSIGNDTAIIQCRVISHYSKQF